MAKREKSRIEELTEQYNASCEALHAAIKAIEEADNSANLEELRANLEAAEVEANRCKNNLEDAKRLQEIKRNFQPTKVESEMELKSSPTYLGMDRKQVREYSIVRAIRALASGSWKGAELEKEASDEIAKRLGREPQGVFVPMDIQTEQRMLVVSDPALGGNLVSTDLLAASFIEVLRNKMVVYQAGATVLSGLVGDVAIPRQTQGATFGWVGEGGDVAGQDQKFDQVKLVPKTCGAYTDISRKLILQSSVDVENLVRNDLATAIALGIDYACLHGTGTNNQPKGLASIGILEVNADINNVTYADVVTLESVVAAKNADVGSLCYVMNAATRGLLKQTEKAEGTAQFIWEPGNTVNGYKALVSNQVEGTMFFGNFADLLIGLWGVLDIIVDPYSLSRSGSLRIVVLQDADIAVRHEESFSMIVS